jgi:hypothetical protein
MRDLKVGQASRPVSFSEPGPRRQPSRDQRERSFHRVPGFTEDWPEGLSYSESVTRAH